MMLPGIAWLDERDLVSMCQVCRRYPTDLILRRPRSCAAVSKDGPRHWLAPSFETHRYAMLLRMRPVFGPAATRLVGPRRSVA